MNILQIAPQIPYPLIDGGKLGIYGITKSLSDRNHKIDFLTYLKDSNLEECKEELKGVCDLYAVEADITYKKIDAFKNFFSKIPYNIEKFLTSEFHNQLIDLLKSNKYDIVHIDHLHMAWTFDIVKQYQNIPVILRQHNVEMKIMERYAEEETNRFLKFYCKKQVQKFSDYEVSTCAKFDNCLMITKDDEQVLLESNKDIKTSVIPAGVEEKLFTLSRNETEPFSIVHLGSMEWLPNKSGLEWYLSEVFPKIVKIFPEVKLYLIGKGTDKLKIDEIVSENVVQLGFVDDLWFEVMKKDLAIVPLKSGSGMRIKIIEMLAAGQNIISTNIGAEGIGATHLENILIADITEDFIKETINYFNNKYSKSDLAEAAKEFCKNKFNWKIIGEEIEKIYLDAIEKNNTGN